LETPEIHYALSGDVSIAYAVIGGGPVDLVFVYGFVGNLDFGFEIPQFARCYERLASFSRLIAFDRRGTGLSDRPREAATLESRMDDVRAVLDAVGSERAVLFGSFEAASMCLLFAATYPERVLGLVLYNPVAKGTWAPDYPWADPKPVRSSTRYAGPGGRPSSRKGWRGRWLRRSLTIPTSSDRSRACTGSAQAPARW
jgi:pimeloyl-ACP methyl ester carboxylesterase